MLILKDAQCYDRGYYIPESFLVQFLVLELLSILYVTVVNSNLKLGQPVPTRVPILKRPGPGGGASNGECGGGEAPSPKKKYLPISAESRKKRYYYFRILRISYVKMATSDDQKMY